MAATVATVSTHARPPAPPQRPRLADRHLRRTPRPRDNVVLKWDEQLLSTIRAYPPQTGPTVAARALAEVHTAMYDAWAAYDQTAVGATPGAPVRAGRRHRGRPRTEAMSYAAYRTLVDLFPWLTATRPRTSRTRARTRTPDELLRGQGYDPANDEPRTSARRPAWATRRPRR